MIITINGKDLELKFGVRFLREMDKRFTIEQEDMKLGFGVEYAIIQLKRGDTTILVEIIESALKTARNRPTPTTIEDFLDDMSEDELDEFVEQVYEEIKESTSAKKRVATLLDKELKK